MKRDHSRTFPVFLAFLLCMTLLCGTLYRCRSDASMTSASIQTIVLDAGHGGEDGGASDAKGRCEKDLNLALATKVRDYLTENGVSVLMTREDDHMLYDKSPNASGSKKRRDLEGRLAVCNQVINPVFVSIHMNSFPQTQYHGLQVWYGTKNETSKALAEAVQSEIKATLQPENERAVKAATSAIFLLSNLDCPAILVECGFLSNPEEAERLQDEEYQNALAKEISIAILKTLF